jgi:DNA modification methylase
MYRYNNAKTYIKDVRDKKIGIPYKRIYYTDKDIHQMMTNLQNVTFKEGDRLRTGEYYCIRNIDYSQAELRYMGSPVLLIHKPEDYDNINNLSDMFQEENRLKCKLYAERRAPEKYFYKHIEQLAYACIKYNKVITPKIMREQMYRNVKECTSFRPLNLTYILQLYNAKSILDFSSGWGDRLIACLATNTRYIGVDPNELLHPKYKQIIEFFAQPKDRKKFTMIQATIQESVLPDEKVDLVFTSPPYFNMEVYSGKGKVNEENESDWFNNFLKVAIKKCLKSLNLGGHMVLVINQKLNEKYIRNMCDYINEEITNLHYLGVISYTKSSRSNPQPMWIWEKCNTVPEKLYNPPVVITEHEYKNVKFNVFRDDKLIGGTKQRAMIPLMLKSKKKTFVYAGPVTGYAQVAIAYGAFLTRKKAVVFLNKQKERTSLTKYSATFAPSIEIREIKDGNLKKIQEIATAYTKKTNSYQMAFGGDSPDYVKELCNSLKRALPRGLEPKRIWLVAGSATILKVLYKIYTNTHFNVVQVGKKIWPDQIITERTTLYISDEKFMDVAKHQPPYPTVATYDAKLWTFFKQHGRSGDYIWNVGADLP